MGKFTDRFRRIDRWMETAPASLILLCAALGAFCLMFCIMFFVVLIGYGLPTQPQKIEIYVDPPRIKTPQEK